MSIADAKNDFVVTTIQMWANIPSSSSGISSHHRRTVLLNA